MRGGAGGVADGAALLDGERAGAETAGLAAAVAVPRARVTSLTVTPLVALLPARVKFRRADQAGGAGIGVAAAESGVAAVSGK